MCFYVTVNCTFTGCKANKSESSFHPVYSVRYWECCANSNIALTCSAKIKTKWKNRLSQLRSQLRRSRGHRLCSPQQWLKSSALGVFVIANTRFHSHTHMRAYAFSLHQTEIIIPKKNRFALQKHETTRACHFHSVIHVKFVYFLKHPQLIERAHQSRQAAGASRELPLKNESVVRIFFPISTAN